VPYVFHSLTRDAAFGKDDFHSCTVSSADAADVPSYRRYATLQGAASISSYLFEMRP